MTSDRKPDQRFAMIAMELTTEISLPPMPEVADPNALIVDADGIRCPRCNLRALMPMTTMWSVAESAQIGGAYSMVCLGCPDNPVFDTPADVVAFTDAYECEKCGVTPQVTMTMPDLNLYCVRCKSLTPHTRCSVKEARRSGRDQASYFEGLRSTIKTMMASSPRLPEWDTLELAVQTGWFNNIRERSAPIDSEPTMRDAPPRQPSREVAPKRWVFVANKIWDSCPDDYPPLVKLTEAIMSVLGLKDWDQHAAAVQRVNVMYRRKQGGSLRGTGRSTRGIVNLLARHYLARNSARDPVNPTVWVLGGSSDVDRWLLRKLDDTKNRLNRGPDAYASVPSDKLGIVCRKLVPPPGVMLLVDHTFYESDRSKGLENISNYAFED